MKILFVLSILFFLIVAFLYQLKALQMLQQNRYNRGYRYIKWILRNFKDNFLQVSLLYFIFFFTYFSETLNAISPYLFIFITFFTGCVFLFDRYKEQRKLPLKYTARILRLILSSFFLYGVFLLLLFFTFEEQYMSFYYLGFGVLYNLTYFIALFCNFLNRPIEKLVAYLYKRKTLKRLATMPQMEVIGITGSYGKTSTKNILYDVLDSSFNVKTPENYNTPFGLMISINDYLDKYNDYFIAEMGACKKGEIKELCDLVHPKYGILTKIGVAHLETFGSEEMIQKTKFELIENLPSDGIGILNGDDEKQRNYTIQNDCQIIWIGIENKKVDLYAKDIKLTNEGTSFKVYFPKIKKEYAFETRLLGRNNIYNILASIALGKSLGVSIPDLQRAVKRAEPVAHRLTILEYYDVHIIDDAYNSNPSGAKMALEVLQMMPGKHIVVTPGMIEVGEKEEEVNREFGREIADVADEVILIGEEKTRPIYEGLMEKKYKKEHIYILNNVLDAFPLLLKLKEGETYCLLENDLPDTFNEK